MVGKNFMAIVVLSLPLASLSSLLQDPANHSLGASNSSSDAVPNSLSEDVLVSLGLNFDDRPRRLCEIKGSEGTCSVEAFVSGEKTTDKAQYTCSKLDRANYVGHCDHGKLDGLSLVIADGTTKNTRQAFIAYFHEGRIAYPALTSFLTGTANLGVQEKTKSYGCVYFGKWDESAKRCGLFMEIYGADIFTEINAQKLREGSFDLGYYRAKFFEFMRRSARPVGAPPEAQAGAASQSTPNLAASPTASPSAGPDSTRLEVLKSPRPVYPLEARTQELQGQVWIKLLISETGDVETTEIVSGNPILAKAAADAMKNWKFKPFIKNGHPVKVSTKLPFDFAIQGNIFDTPSKPVAQSPDSETEGGPPTPAREASTPRMLRVSQGVMEGNLVHRVDPVYPPEARRNHIQGDVLLTARIGKDGRIHNVKAVYGPKELIEASIGAVEQWRYRPYLLKGEPVEVETTIKIQFHM